MLLPFVPPPPPEAREARGRNQRRRDANLHGGICPGSPAVRGGARAAGLGVGGEKKARGLERGLEPRPRQRGGGAWPGGWGERRGSKTCEPACWLVGVALPWPRAEGRGVARVAGGGGGALAVPGCRTFEVGSLPSKCKSDRAPFSPTSALTPSECGTQDPFSSLAQLMLLHPRWLYFLECLSRLAKSSVPSFRRSSLVSVQLCLPQAWAP